MSDSIFRLVFVGIYGHLLMRFSYLASSNPVLKHGLQYLHPNYIVCHVLTQNPGILLSNRHLSHKIMAYNNENALSRDKFGRKKLGYCSSYAKNRTSVLYATFLPIVAALWRANFSYNRADDTDYIRVYPYVRHFARSLLSPEVLGQF